MFRNRSWQRKIVTKHLRTPTRLFCLQRSKARVANFELLAHLLEAWKRLHPRYRIALSPVACAAGQAASCEALPRLARCPLP